MDRLSRFHDRHLLVRPDEGSFSSESQLARWSNRDLDPVPRSQKKWEWYHVGGFWIAEGFSVGQMQTASASVAIGLNPGLTLVAYLIGNLMVAVACCGSGYIGSKNSINFPVIARASFGLWGSFLPIAIRAAVGPIWYGIQSYLGSLGVQCMIEAIWPSFHSWHMDAIPASAGIDAPGLLSFTIFWLTILPLLRISIPSLRWLFIIKIVIMPFFAVALFAWAVTAADGFGPLFTIPTKIENGFSVGYAFCYGITAASSSANTFAVNMPDVTRYAHNPRTSTIAQAVGLPVCFTLTFLLGVTLAATSQVLYGEVYWNPLEMVQVWDNRAGKFFAGLLFAFANIGNVIAGNSVPFGNDFMALFPQYFTIRRGQYLCAVLGFAICPWKIEASASRFLAFLNGYSIFLGPIAGVMLTDYFLIRKRIGYNVYHLYKPRGLYWYRDGVNLRAIAAFSIGMIPQLPGLVYQINPKVSGLSRGYIYFTSLSWLDSVVFASISYYLLCRVLPFDLQTDELDKAAWAIEGHAPSSCSASQEASDPEKTTASMIV